MNLALLALDLRNRELLVFEEDINRVETKEHLGRILARNLGVVEDSLATRVHLDELRQVIHDAVDNNPEVIGFVVLRDLVAADALELLLDRHVRLRNVKGAETCFYCQRRVWGTTGYVQRITNSAVAFSPPVIGLASIRQCICRTHTWLPRKMMQLHTTLCAQTRVTVVDPLAGRPEPAVVPRAPPSGVWVRRSTRKSRSEPPPAKRTRADPYCDAELLRQVVEAVVAFRRERGHDQPWWTRRIESMHVQRCDVDVAAATRDPQAPRCAASGALETLGNRLVVNDSGAQTQVRWRNAHIHVPPRCAFLVADLLSGCRPAAWVQVDELFSAIGAPDVVVLDPPWPNRSAQRAVSAYAPCADIYDMWRVRPVLEAVLRSETLVAVWVTNHPKVQDFVRHKFLPGFGLYVHAEWAWLKVVADGPDAGEPVLPHDTPWHRKPYEVVVLASRKKTRRIAPHVIVCPPVGHSAKPNLGSLLLEAASIPPSAGAVVLELFSRCAASPRAGAWHVGMGDEACKLNVTV